MQCYGKIAHPLSPDMNLIEHTWNMLSRRCKNAPAKRRKLAAAVTEEWADIPREVLRHLFSRLAPSCKIVEVENVKFVRVGGY